MKNETARREIESLDYYLQSHTDDYSEESHTAMMMGIKALEQEPCEDMTTAYLMGYYADKEPCDDCISRQAVLDLVYADWKYEGLETHVESLPPVTPQPKWIPVSERLPKEDGLYLVYTEEQPFVCPFKDSEFFIDEVLAWMPLPESYKGE